MKKSITYAEGYKPWLKEKSTLTLDADDVRDLSIEIKEFIRDNTRGESFDCPHCFHALKVELNAHGWAVRQEKRTPLFKKVEQNILDLLESNGALSCFVSACNAQNIVEAKSYKASLLALLIKGRLRQPSIPDRPALNLLLGFEPEKLLVNHEGVFAVIQKDKLVGFFGRNDLKRAREAMAMKSDAFTKKIQDVWIKTRNGYVLKNSILLSSLAGVRPGEFCTTGL